MTPTRRIAGQTLHVTNTTLGVLANDSSGNGKALTATLVSGPSNGQLTLNSDGTFSYTPNAGFTGTDTFTYTASDGSSTSAPATVTITVVGILARDDAYTDLLNQELFVWTSNGVLVNDLGADYLYLTATLVSGPSHGTLSLFDAGNFNYLPDYGFVGTDTFTYTASDGINTSNVATVTITVEPVQANDDVYVTPENTPLTITAASTSPMHYCVYTPQNFDSYVAAVILLQDYPNVQMYGGGYSDVTQAAVQESLTNSYNQINTIIAWQVNVTPDAQAYAAANGVQIITAASSAICGMRCFRLPRRRQSGVLTNDLIIIVIRLPRTGERPVRRPVHAQR